MNKNRIYFLLTLAMSTGFWGCEKFLDEENPYQVTTEFLYNTKDGLQSAVNGLYSLERAQVDDNESSDFAVVIGDCGTDIDFMRAALNHCVARYRPDLYFPDQGVVASWWRKEYRIIERANSIITFGSEADIAPQDKKAILREAYIHRANAYFWLIRKFDNIWLNLEPTTSENYDNRTFEVASQDEVYQVIISDLDSAISYFGNDYTTWPGQLGLGAALFLRIDVALWRKDYQVAAALAERLISDGPYHLVEPEDVFTKNGWNNSAEGIYVMQFDEFAIGGADVSTTSGGPSGHRLALVFTADYKQVPGTTMVSEYGGYGWSRVHPNEYLLGLYNSKYDKRWDAWWQHYYTYNNESFDFSSVPYQFGDTLEYGQNAMLTGTNFFKDAHVGCKKYFDWVKLANTTRSFNNIYIYRISEVFLMAAEAHFRLGNTGKALEFINILRQNRISPEDPNQLFTSIEEETILEEHARELAFEGRRWFFLKRQGLLVERVRASGGTTMFRGIIATDPSWYSARTQIQNFHVRWPIPQAEIDAMGSFPQNPGY